MRRQLSVALGDITRSRADALCTSANAGLCGNRTPTYWRFRVGLAADASAAAARGVGFLSRALSPRTEDRAMLLDSAPYRNVDGAVHDAAGPELQHALDGTRGTAAPWRRGRGPRGAILPGSSERGTCPAGCAVVTPAFGRLHARLVVHAVAPDGRGHTPPRRGPDPRFQLLVATYAAAIAEAGVAGARSVAIPALGCGVHGWHARASSRAALEAATAWAREPSPCVHRVAFVLLSDEARAAWEACARHCLGAPSALEEGGTLVWDVATGHMA